MKKVVLVVRVVCCVAGLVGCGFALYRHDTLAAVGFGMVSGGFLLRLP